MIKVHGIAPSVSSTSSALRSVLEELTIEFRNKCHSAYLRHQVQLVDDLDKKLENSKDSFQSHILEMVDAYNDVSFTTPYGDIEGKVVARNWLIDALDRYSLQINIFLQE
eukprot:Gb_08361 [translate_table: standard]